MVFRDLNNPNEPVEPVDEMHLSFKHHLLSWFLGFYLLCVCVFFVAISNPRNLTMVFKAPFDLHRRPWPRALSSFRKGHQTSGPVQQCIHAPRMQTVTCQGFSPCES